MIGTLRRVDASQVEVGDLIAGDDPDLALEEFDPDPRAHDAVGVLRVDRRYADLIRFEVIDLGWDVRWTAYGDVEATVLRWRPEALDG